MNNQPSDVPPARNLHEGVPACLPAEWTELLHEAPGARIERIVSQGQCSPEGFWYDQEMDEFVLLVSGRARLEFDGVAAPVELKPGDHLLIPAHVRHRVAWTDPAQQSVWLAVHVGGRAGS